MTETTLYCANHPDRETGLRCNRCGKPICSSCAVRTPVGYRCPECVRSQQKLFDTNLQRDYALAVVIAALGAGIGIGILGFLGFFGLLLAPLLGGGIAEAVRWAVSRRRSRRLPLLAAIGAGVGTVPHLLLPLLGLVGAMASGAGMQVLPGAMLGLLWPLIEAALLISALYYRLGGIRVG
jgi:hypothetical protein